MGRKVWIMNCPQTAQISADPEKEIFSNPFHSKWAESIFRIFRKIFRNMGRRILIVILIPHQSMPGRGATIALISG
jgi:hypothetical protein